MPGAIRGLLRALALRRGRFTSLFLRLGGPTPVEYADILRRSGRFQSIGRDVGIVYGTHRRLRESSEGGGERKRGRRGSEDSRKRLCVLVTGPLPVTLAQEPRFHGPPSSTDSY